MEYQGPRTAALNQAQTGVMDAQAAAGNAFGMPMTSAAGSLPQVSQIGGMDVYDTLGIAEAGRPQAQVDMFSKIFGPGGMMARYGRGGGGGQPQYPGGGIPTGGNSNNNIWLQQLLQGGGRNGRR